MVEIGTHFTELSRVLSSLDQEELSALRYFVRSCEGTLWLCGNGGSWANAQHWACDLAKAANRRVVALGSNSSSLTAWTNDEEYANAFARELKSVSRYGDRVLCLSCSGSSMNILTVLRQAWMLKMPSALLTGANWLSPTPVHLVLNVPSVDFATIEDAHMAIGHWLTKELQEGA